MNRSSLFLAIVGCSAWLLAACSDKGQPAGGGDAPAEQAARDGGLDAALGDAASGDGGTMHQAGGDGGARAADGAVIAGDASTVALPDAGDAGRSACATTCPAPSMCQVISGGVFCVCPAGYHFVDVGDDQPPCAEDCNDCDGG